MSERKPSPRVYIQNACTGAEFHGYLLTIDGGTASVLTDQGAIERVDVKEVRTTDVPAFLAWYDNLPQPTNESIAALIELAEQQRRVELFYSTKEENRGPGYTTSMRTNYVKGSEIEWPIHIQQSPFEY